MSVKCYWSGCSPAGWCIALLHAYIGLHRQIRQHPLCLAHVYRALHAVSFRSCMLKDTIALFCAIGHALKDCFYLMQSHWSYGDWWGGWRMLKFITAAMICFSHSVRSLLLCNSISHNIAPEIKPVHVQIILNWKSLKSEMHEGGSRIFLMKRISCAAEARRLRPSCWVLCNFVLWWMKMNTVHLA